MCQERLLIELQPPLVDTSVSLALLPWVGLIAKHPAAAVW